MQTNQYLPPEGRAGAASLPALSDDEFSSIVQQVRNNQRDADRLRLLKNLVLSYTVSCVQAKAFVEELEFTEGKVEVAVLLHPATHDGERYEEVLAALRFEEQKQEVRAQCQLAAAPAAPAQAPTSAPAARAPAQQAEPAKEMNSWMRRKPVDSDEEDSD